MSPRPGNNNSELAFFRVIAWLIVLMGIPIALDMVGPWQGWIVRLHQQVAPYFTDRERTPVEQREGYDSLFATPDRSDPSDRADRSDRADPASASESHAEELTRNPEAQTPLEKQFRTLYEEVLEVLPKPKPGTIYTVRTRNRERLKGRLIEIRPGRLILETQYGRLGIPIDSLHPDEVKRFFPSREAKNRALEILAFRDQRKNANTVNPTGEEGASDVASAAPEPDLSSVPSQRPSRSSSSSVKFDPAAEKSDPSLLPLVQAFADWLEVQHRRIGGKVADKVFAHHQNGAVILYLILNPHFMAQSYETRYQFAESLWQFWGFRAREFGVVSSPDDAYIVFLDSNRKPVGGSRPDSGSKVWMKGGEGTVTAQR